MFQNHPIQRALRGRLRFVGCGTQGHDAEHRRDACQEESTRKTE
jgi:hypothetical protein